MPYVVGIDLGTTNSAIAILRDGRPEMLPNSEGNPTMPSVVGINPKTGELAVGEEAKGLGANMHKVIEVKRLMGTAEKVRLGDQLFTPQAISAMILRKLKADAEAYLGEPIQEAVITVPAYFTDAQRTATKEAGELAGLRVERIINEPTAASLAFGLKNREKQMNILVYDLGGGTFDVSVVELFDGVIEVKASAGDAHLGGADIDELLMKLVADEFEREHGINLLADPAAASRLKGEAEHVKIRLSATLTASFDLPMIILKENVPLSLNRLITRQELEELIEPLLQRTRAPIEKALKASGLSREELDEVILVGGSTRIPRSRLLVEEWLGQRPKWSVNPDQAVALGAAVQGAIKSGALRADEGLVVLELSPFSLGIECVSDWAGLRYHDAFSELIAPNTKIPCEKTDRYRSMVDDQELVQVRVFQGQGGERRTSEPTMKLIEEFDVPGVPPGPAGSQGIEITFKYDINGTLDVAAKILSTGKTVAHRVVPTADRLTDEQRRHEAAKVEAVWQHSELAKRVQPLVHKAEQVLGALSGAERQRLAQLLEELKQVVAAGQQARVGQLEEDLTDVLFDLESR